MRVNVPYDPFYPLNSGYFSKPTNTRLLEPTKIAVSSPITAGPCSIPFEMKNTGTFRYGNANPSSPSKLLFHLILQIRL